MNSLCPTKKSLNASAAVSFGVTNTKHAEVFPYSALAIASSPYAVNRDLFSTMVSQPTAVDHS